MLDKSFYQGEQGECFRQLDKHWQDIKHEFDSQPNKTFLDPEDFSDSVRGLPEDFDDRSGTTLVANGGRWAYSQAITRDSRSMTIPCCTQYLGNSHTRP